MAILGPRQCGKSTTAKLILEPKNCKRPVAEYARHRTRSHSELLQVSDNAADSATGRSRRVRCFEFFPTHHFGEIISDEY